MTQLWERWSGRSGEACPFGVVLRPSGEDVSPPFDTWEYRPAYLPSPLAIHVARDVPLTEPGFFYLPFQPDRARLGELASRTGKAPATLTHVTFGGPQPARSPAARIVQAERLVHDPARGATRHDPAPHRRQGQSRCRSASRPAARAGVVVSTAPRQSCWHPRSQSRSSSQLSSLRPRAACGVAINPGEHRPASMASASARPPCPPGTSRQRSDEPARRKTGADGAASTPITCVILPAPRGGCRVRYSHLPRQLPEHAAVARRSAPQARHPGSSRTPRLAPQLKGAPSWAEFSRSSSRCCSRSAPPLRLKRPREPSLAPFTTAPVPSFLASPSPPGTSRPAPPAAS